MGALPLLWPAGIAVAEALEAAAIGLGIIGAGAVAADQISKANTKAKEGLKDEVISETCKDCDKPKKYWCVTYTKTKFENGRLVTYSGRTYGYGATPQDVLKARDLNHHMNGQGFGPAILDRSIEASGPHDIMAKAAIRGREQMLIDRFGGAQSQGGTSGNRINGISPLNPLKDFYIEAAKMRFGEVK